MALDPAALLDEVETAISAVLLGQEITYRDKKMTRADLSQLWKIRNDLKVEVDRAGKGIKVYGAQVSH